MGKNGLTCLPSTRQNLNFVQMHILESLVGYHSLSARLVNLTLYIKKCGKNLKCIFTTRKNFRYQGYEIQNLDRISTTIENENNLEIRPAFQRKHCEAPKALKKACFIGRGDCGRMYRMYHTNINSFNINIIHIG